MKRLLLILALIVASVGAQAQVAGPVPTNTKAFISMFGMNTHIDFSSTVYYNNPIAIGSAMAYLGFNQIRQPMVPGYNSSSYNGLASAGLSLDVDMQLGNSDTIGQVAAVNTFLTANPGHIASIEGPNEIANWPVTFSGQTGVAGAVLLMQDLYPRVRANPQTVNIPVTMLTLLMQASTSGAGNQSAFATWGNAHVYPQVANGGGITPYTALTANIPYQVNTFTPTLTTAITEAGYYTSNVNTYGVNNDVQMRYMLDYMFDAAVQGLPKVYFYELFDNACDPGNTNSEFHFGVFLCDTTTAKPAAAAIHNLTTIVADPGTPSTIPTSYTTTGLPNSAMTIGLAKSNGATDIVVWAEPVIWDQTTHTQIAPPNNTVTISLPRTFASAKVFDPTVGISAQSTLTNVSSVTVTVTDHPIIVEVTPTLAGTWSSVQSVNVPGMTNGHMFYQYLPLNYSSTNPIKSPILVYEHENSEGDKCYPNNPGACTQLTALLSAGGSGVQDWYNNTAFQGRYCPNGCIVVSVAADQTSDPSGSTSNFGGYADSDTNPDPNEKGVIAVIQQILATLNADPNRVYVTGDSLGGIGSQAIGLDYGINTGLLGHIITATMPFSGAIYRGGLTAPTSAQLGRLQGGGFQFNINGVGDTGTSSNPALWTEPLWRAITGNSSYPGQPLGGRAGSSPIYVLVDTSLGHDVWDTYRPLPKGQPMLDLLFSQTASGGGCIGACLTGPTKSVLPSGYLRTSGNQIQDGAANNVRLACSNYANPTASPTSDMSVMRTQGFNCATVPWFDKVTCPAGVCNFSAFDGIVAAATAANMRVVFVHQANEGINGSGACTQQQANGLWYDLGGATNGTDGCGTTGTVSYAQFKANWLAFASHYSGNQTVIGFDLHNEPTTFGNPACCNTGGGGGTGQFQIINGQVIDPNGNLFIANGINVDEEEAPKAITNSAAQPLTTLFPHINFIRVPVRATANVGGANAVYPNPATYATFIQRATANGIVVEFEDHNSNGGQWECFISGPLACTPSYPPTGGALTTMTNFWASLASMYKTNPYVWIGSLNEINSADGTYGLSAIAATTTYENALYNAVRGTGNNNIIQMGNGVGGGNPGTVGVNSGQNASLTANWHNVTWYMHSYYTNGTPSGALAQLQGSTAACCGGSGGSGYTAAQTLHSADGIVPVIVDECGSGTGNSSNGDASAIVSALGTIRSLGYGVVCWAWFPSAQWQMVNNGDTSGGPFSLTTWGTQMSNLIASAPAPIPPGSGATIGANWGTGNGGDMKAMVEDVGGAIQAADPGALIMVEGIFNNGSLFNGTARGSSALPITAGSIGDLSTIGSLPVVCCAAHVVYAIHDQPTDLSGVAPDAGTAATTMRNTAWGYLETTNKAPVWIGRLGASLDNTNGQLSDENAWATGLTQYMAGQLSGQGAPAFTGCQEPLGGSWATFGYLPGQAIDGTLNSDGTNKAGQQTFWTTMLYTQCSTQNQSGGVGATTWNPTDASAGIALDGTKLIATTAVTGSQSVRSTTSQNAGKVCFAAVATTISADWDFGISNSSYLLTTGGGLGADSNGIGFDPRSTGGLQGIFYNNALLSSGAGTSPNGEEQLICADLTNKLLWATNATMRGNGNPWNNSTTANPATGAGGLPFAGLTCPCFITWNENQSGVATLNAAGPFAVSVPAGFSAWQQPVTSGGHPMVLIFGAIDPNPFTQPMDLTR